MVDVLIQRVATPRTQDALRDYEQRAQVHCVALSANKKMCVVSGSLQCRAASAATQADAHEGDAGAALCCTACSAQLHCTPATLGWHNTT